MEGCPEPDNSSGQWQYIPEEYCNQHDLNFRDDCSCKKGDCLRNCKLRPPKQKPGRKGKRAAADRGGSPTAIDLDEVGPRPPILVSITEIWNERCASSPARPLGQGTNF